MENTRELKEERLQRPQADTLRMELQVGGARLLITLLNPPGPRRRMRREG